MHVFDVCTCKLVERPYYDIHVAYAVLSISTKRPKFDKEIINMLKQLLTKGSDTNDKKINVGFPGE